MRKCWRGEWSCSTMNSSALSSILTPTTSSYGTVTPSTTRADHDGASDSPGGAASSCTRAGLYHDMPARQRAVPSSSTPLPVSSAKASVAEVGAAAWPSRVGLAVIVIDFKFGADPGAFPKTLLM